MFFDFAFGVDKDVIDVYYHKNVKVFCQDLVNIALEYGRYISQSKRHYLVLEIAIAGHEGCLLFIAFLNPHLIVGID